MVNICCPCIDIGEVIMNIFGIILVSLVLAGLLYFWQKASVHGVSFIAMIFAFLFWPVGATVGLYWAVKDLYFHYRK